MLVKPLRTPANPPRHLDKPERDLWREITSQFDFSDAASTALLASALDAHQRARRCREAIEATGQTVKDRFGQLQAHPLLGAETAARRAFLSAMKTLNLDISGDK